MLKSALAKGDRAIARWTIAAYSCVTAALLLVMGITGWGAYIDYYEVRITFLQGEVNRIRSHAVRTVARLQDRLGTLLHRSDPETALLEAVHEENWLREYWNRWIPSDESRLYAAIEGPGGRIIMHSDAHKELGRLESNWYDRIVSETDDDDIADNDVVETHSPAITGGRRAYDVSLPILMRDKEIARYHSGLSCEWFERELAQKNVSTRNRWIGVFGGMLFVVAVAGYSLYKIVRRTIMLREAVEMAQVRQFAELGELAAGIAHEIRNPINAIRLNLHALDRMYRDGRAAQSGESSSQIIAEANREIQRVEGLMRIMLGYARPEKSHDEDFDLRGELEATLQFIRPVMQRDEVHIEAALGVGPAVVHMDRARLRQILLNLLNNAREAVGAKGRVRVTLARDRGQVEIAIADNGPGVPPGDRQRIFDPFYSTKELGTGLGLALVKRFVEEASGEVSCDEGPDGGALFRLRLPEVVHEPPLESAAR